MVDRTLYITQNTPYITTIIVRNAQGAAIDLTDYTGAMRISKWYGSSTVYNISVTIPTPLEGIVRISINSTGTGLLPYGTMVYSLFLTPPGVDADKVLTLKGSVVIIPTIGYSIPLEPEEE